MVLVPPLDYISNKFLKKDKIIVFWKMVGFEFLVRLLMSVSERADESCISKNTIGTECRLIY